MPRADGSSLVPAVQVTSAGGGYRHSSRNRGFTGSPSSQACARKPSARPGRPWPAARADRRLATFRRALGAASPSAPTSAPRAPPLTCLAAASLCSGGPRAPRRPPGRCSATMSWCIRTWARPRRSSAAGRAVRSSTPARSFTRPGPWWADGRRVRAACWRCCPNGGCRCWPTISLSPTAAGPACALRRDARGADGQELGSEERVHHIGACVAAQPGQAQSRELKVTSSQSPCGPALVPDRPGRSSRSRPLRTRHAARGLSQPNWAADPARRGHHHDRRGRRNRPKHLVSAHTGQQRPTCGLPQQRAPVTCHVTGTGNGSRSRHAVRAAAASTGDESWPPRSPPDMVAAGVHGEKTRSSTATGSAGGVKRG